MTNIDDFKAQDHELAPTNESKDFLHFVEELTQPYERKSFSHIAEELTQLYERKNKAYGNSFGQTYQRLGIISAVTRISDKYNRLVSLATNPGIDDLGESIDDTLRDLASYCIMTLMERQTNTPQP